MISTEDVLKIHKLLIDQFGGSHGVRDKMVIAVSMGECKFEQIRDWMTERCK